MDSNHRPIGYEPTALTAELQPRAFEYNRDAKFLDRVLSRPCASYTPGT
jgi:hypothetical protein